MVLFNDCDVFDDGYDVICMSGFSIEGQYICVQTAKSHACVCKLTGSVMIMMMMVVMTMTMTMMMMMTMMTSAGMALCSGREDSPEGSWDSRGAYKYGQ